MLLVPGLALQLLRQDLLQLVQGLALLVELFQGLGGRGHNLGLETRNCSWGPSTTLLGYCLGVFRTQPDGAVPLLEALGEVTLRSRTVASANVEDLMVMVSGSKGGLRVDHVPRLVQRRDGSRPLVKGHPLVELVVVEVRRCGH